MAFDLGQMMEQVMGSINGGGGGGSGGRDDKSGAVYDVAVVGYGPAGGVMVRESLLGERCFVMCAAVCC